MGANSFNEMELDAIGEIMNISLGASATAISTMLGTKVNITTPVAEVLSSEQFSFERLEPAVGVDISYVRGLEGSNVMVFRRDDVRVIVGILMGEEIPEEAFELDEMNISAICEVMNQMMGSSATALSEFLGYPVDISTPKSFEITDDAAFRARYFPNGTERVLVRFTLEIGDVLKSEFMNIMTIDLIKRLLAPFEDTFKSVEEPAASAPAPAPAPAPESGSRYSDGVLSQAQIEAMLASQMESTPQPEEPKPSGGVLSQAEIEAMLAGQTGSAPQPEPQPSGGVLSQAEIEAMLAGQTESAPQPEPQPSGGVLSQAQIEAMLAGQTGSAPQPAAPAQPQPAAPVPPQPSVQPAYAPQPMAVQYQPAMDPMMMQLITQMQQAQMQMMEMMHQMQKERTAAQETPKEKETPRPNAVIHPINSPKFADEGGSGAEEQANQELLMKVPLEISVEIGRTQKLVKDILEFTQGSLVVLDKTAGERADVYVNGECIARGDIVVVDDNFGIRIAEIVNRNVNSESL